MCSVKENCSGCSCDDNAADELFVPMKGYNMTEKKETPKTDETVVLVDGVEYVRKNPKQLIEEPVIPKDDGKTLLTE